MLGVTVTCLRSAAARATRLPSLRRRLQHLRHTNQVAEEQLQERRRLQRLLRDTQSSNTGSSAAGESVNEATTRAIRLLPRNDALEAAMALSISENRDARTELELVRRLINSTLLSLASPVDRRWDPYDVKPQVFALNTYIVLPVFTSIHYLRLFCQRFGFAVRDPSGVLWAAGDATSTTGGDGDVQIAGLLPGGVVQSEWWSHHRRAPSVHTTEVRIDETDRSEAAASTPRSSKEEDDATMATARSAAAEASSTGKGNENATSTSFAKHDASPAETSDAPMDAASLFDAMSMEGVSDETTTTAPTKKRARKKGKTVGSAHRRRGADRRVQLQRKQHRRKRRASPHAETATSAPDSEAAKKKNEEEDAARSAYWQAVAQTAPFELRQATPLPTFGPFLYPFLVGYFADIATLLHNAAIVPEKVDVVVNPGSPIEFVLARAATDRILHKEQLLHAAYLKVEKELQREFGAFFSRYCPEVVSASSACVPLPMDADEVVSARRASRSAVHGPPGTAGGATSSADANPLQEYRERTRLLREAEYRNGVAYELTVLIQSTSLEETFMKIQQAKHRSMLMGHADLDVLPEAAAAPHVREMAQLFYDGPSEAEKRTALQSIAGATANEEGEEGADHVYANTSMSASPGTPHMGVFVRRGTPRTVNVAQSADSYFHDPTNAYTEAHAVFTEELKVKKGQ